MKAFHSIRTAGGDLTASRGAPRRPKHPHGSRRRLFGVPNRVVAAGVVMSLVAAIGQSATIAAQAVTAPVGEGFTVTASDLAFILKQIKIAEAHVANTTSATGPCGALIGTGPNQIPDALTSYGLRTVDGSCNNLLAGRETFGAADQKFPRYTTPVFNDADPVPAGFGPAGPTSYKQKSGNVFDSKPRDISNLIVDQTSTNPAAVAAAGFPVRTQGDAGVHPCTTDPDPLATPPVVGVPAGCVPSHNTLFIPNVTTDVGLSPPYNSMFTLFGQFFDHGVDQTVKSGGNVFVPLQADDPLVAGPDHVFGNADDLPANQRFMVLTRAQNQPGPDGVLGTADDVQDASNTDSPWVDQSQTYTSHPSHQVFVREYVNNTDGKPVSTGKLLGGTAGTKAANGMATWANVKEQAKTLLGIQLLDKDVLNVPAARRRPLRQVHSRSRPRPAAVRDRQRTRRGRTAPTTAALAPWCRQMSNTSTPRSSRTSRTTPTRPRRTRTTTRQPRRLHRRPTPTRSPRQISPASLPAPTTTKCWTRTSSPVTAASTRTSA